MEENQKEKSSGNFRHYFIRKLSAHRKKLANSVINNISVLNFPNEQQMYIGNNNKKQRRTTFYFLYAFYSKICSFWVFF